MTDFKLHLLLPYLNANNKTKMAAYVGVGHVDDLGEEVGRHLLERREEVLDLGRVGQLLTGDLKPLLLDVVHTLVL